MWPFYIDFPTVWETVHTTDVTVVSCADVSFVWANIRVTDVANIDFDSFSPCWNTSINDKYNKIP